MNDSIDPPPLAESRRQLLKRELRSMVPLALAVIFVILAVILLGREAERHLHQMEMAIEALGPWGRVAFVALLVVATSVLVPDSLFGLVAGALFGMVCGVGLMLIGNLIAAALQYALARRLLHDPIQRALESRPLLRSIQAAVIRDEMHLQLLLRLTPLNPALISYLLGAAGVRFVGFMLAMLVLTLHFIVEVYIGYAGKQLVTGELTSSHGGWQHHLLVYGAAALGVIAIVLVSKAAHRAVLRAIAETASDNNGHDPS